MTKKTVRTMRKALWTMQWVVEVFTEVAKRVLPQKGDIVAIKNNIINERYELIKAMYTMYDNTPAEIRRAGFGQMVDTFRYQLDHIYMVDPVIFTNYLLGAITGRSYTIRQYLACRCNFIF